MQFDVLKSAGITQQEFAQLVPVSRVTVNNWVRRRTLPNKERRRVKSLLIALRLAVDRGMLPGTLPRQSRTASDERMTHIRNVLREVVATAKRQRATEA